MFAGRFRHFNKLDLPHAYLLFKIRESDRKLFAFEFKGRLYQWSAMIFGIPTAGEFLQFVMESILAPAYRGTASSPTRTTSSSGGTTTRNSP